MNRSELADADTCLSCGKCCQSFRLWFERTTGVGERLTLLAGESIVEVPQEEFPDQLLVEMRTPCIHHIVGEGCGIYGNPSRPSLCSEFPDNLFNRNPDGNLVLNDDHARSMIALYSDYCPIVQRVGRTPPAFCPDPPDLGFTLTPEPPRMATSSTAVSSHNDLDTSS